MTRYQFDAADDKTLEITANNSFSGLYNAVFTAYYDGRMRQTDEIEELIDAVDLPHSVESATVALDADQAEDLYHALREAAQVHADEGRNGTSKRLDDTAAELAFAKTRLE